MNRTLKTTFVACLILLACNFLYQCKGGVEPLLGDITGPDAIGEYSSVEYAIPSDNLTGAQYTWTVNPPHAGNFETPEAARTNFISAGIDADLPIEISVVVESDQAGPVIKKKDATIFNLTGYAHSWGGDGYDTAKAIAVDRSNHLYIAGEYSDMVDLDPGPGTDIRTGCGSYLAKYDAEGGYRWGRTWEESTPGLSTRGLAVADNGDVYVAGDFLYPVDFDPGPGIDERTSNGRDDAFLSKFDMYGNYLWTLTWGGSGYDMGEDVMVDRNGNVYVTGSWSKTVDFDPGPGVDERDFIWNLDGYLSKFDPDGNHIWTATWGGCGYQRGLSVVADTAGDLYITGSFSRFTDFDPGPDIAGFDSIGFVDVFLTKLSTDGDLIWTRTWGGTSYDTGYDVAMDGSGNIYVVGEYDLTVDFDPGPTVAVHTADSNFDVFLSKFNPDGDFQWVLTWGGTSRDHAEGVATDEMNNIYVAGTFFDAVDFDPSTGSDVHYGVDADTGFLSKFDSSGNFQWAQTWDALAYDVATDYRNNAYVVGRYSATADLNPGPVFVPRVANGYNDAYISRFPTDGDW